MNKLNRVMIQEFYCTILVNVQIFPLVAGNSTSTRPAYKRERLYIRLSEAVPMRPFFRAKNSGRWRMNHTSGRNLRGKCMFCLFDLTN